MESVARSITFSAPDASMFRFPPSSKPEPIHPASADTVSLRSPPPFTIQADVFDAALDPRVPLTIACVYAVTVKLLNRYNKSTGKKPWAVSKTGLFQAFVLLHNIFLAAYSAWTFQGMLRGLVASVVSPSGPNGLAGTIDSLCRMEGGSGLGEDVYFDESLGKWTSLSYNAQISSSTGSPLSTTPGRVWNEGLAFYGWIFYLSKFYEVFDTLIILAKGKLSSTLQTYHHAGAMMCMWAGIRYMAPPIWMFVLVNSFIHALMYTYYTFTALSIRVPMAVKRTLTTLQITQFLVGASYAMAHSFISFTVPVTTQIVDPSDEPAATTSTVVATVATGALDSLKKLVFGAAAKASEAAVSTPEAVRDNPVRFKTETTYVEQPCITTTGATFAIWLNILYLAPLTYLFVKFFINSYLRRSNAASTKARGKDRRMSNVAMAEKAGWEAAKNLEREVYGEGAEESLEGKENNHASRINVH